MISLISLWAIPVILFVILTLGLIKKVPIYEEFTEGAKDGFKVAVNIIPYLVAIIVGVSMLRASGVIDMLAQFSAPVLHKFMIPVEALPVMIVRSLSGAAALGLFSDIAHHFGPDSYATKLCAVIVGSSETTFYVLAVYFGSVGIKKLRYAMLTGIIADIIGVVAAIIVCSHFFLPNIG